jgi:hypothetical protein
MDVQPNEQRRAGRAVLPRNRAHGRQHGSRWNPHRRAPFRYLGRESPRPGHGRTVVAGAEATDLSRAAHARTACSRMADLDVRSPWWSRFTPMAHPPPSAFMSGGEAARWLPNVRHVAPQKVPELLDHVVTQANRCRIATRAAASRDRWRDVGAAARTISTSPSPRSDACSSGGTLTSVKVRRGASCRARVELSGLTLAPLRFATNG